MELAVRWNQRSTPSDPRFLIVDVPGRTFKLCRVDDTKGRTVQWREISRNTQAPQFRAFDWNFLHNVVAVGQWSGEVTVLGLQNNSSILSIPLKTHRACNSVAFGSDTVLATGLDRVRNDFCLNIYDIEQWCSPKQDGLARQPASEPLRKLAIAEAIISIKFFPQDSNILVTGVKGVGIRIYDLRDSQSNPAVQYNTSCIHNIAVDSCNTNFFASAGPAKDDTVQIWDRRSATRQNSNLTSQSSSLNEPMLELKNVFKSASQTDLPSIWSLRYSIAEQGSLGVLGNNGAIRIFETKRDWVDREKGSNTIVDELVLPLSVTRTDSLGAYPRAEERRDDADAKDLKILAFDFLNLRDSKGNSAAITMRSAAEVELRPLHRRVPAVATRFTSRASVIISDDSNRSQLGMKMYQASQRGKISDALYTVNRKLSAAGLGFENHLEEEELVNDGWMEDPTQPPKNSEDTSRSSSQRRIQGGHILGTIQDALTVAERARRRCFEGYLLDPGRNTEIVQGNRELEMMWDWISIAKEYADSGGLAQGPINFNYLGVLNIWQNDIGSDISTRVRTGTNIGDIWKRIIEQAKDLELPKIEIPETGRAYHRWLCLYILGFDSREHILLTRVKAMALAGKNSEAALYALLARDPALASIAFRSGPRNTQNKALSLLLSVYATSEDRSSLVDQLDVITASDKDPFIQAIRHLLIIRITSDDPSGLPSIPLLPPRYHIALAFSLLSDGPLKTYLFEQYREAVSGGLLSHIPLTGLSQLSLRIFKRYLARTGDLQSVVLALSYVCPLYINKPRMMAWRSEYRSNLNRYGLFIQRAQFDMQTTKLAIRPDGTTALEPQKRQISLKCVNCDSALHREPDRFVPEEASTLNGSVLFSSSLTPSITRTPTLQSSMSDPTSMMNLGDSFSTPSDPNSSSNVPSQDSSLTNNNLTLPPTPSADARRTTTGFRTPTSPHGSIYSLTNTPNPVTPGLVTPGNTTPMATTIGGLAPNSSSALATPSPSSASNYLQSQQQARFFPAPRDGTICPKCGARMPRCAVCEFWIGETDPRSRGARAAAASKVSSKLFDQNQNVSQRRQNDPTNGRSNIGDDSHKKRNTDQSEGAHGIKDKNNTNGSTTTARNHNDIEEEDDVVVAGEEEHNENNDDDDNDEDDILSGFVDFCLRCKHVYHRKHAVLWFDKAKHVECAAVGCRCTCAL